MAAPDTNCEFKKITFQFPLISLHNLKTAERRKSNFVVWNIHDKKITENISSYMQGQKLSQ